MLQICYTCQSMWCGKKCQPITCDFRFLCIKSAKIDFCATCQVLMLEYFETQFARKYPYRRLRIVKEEEDGN
jgi:hypothetical protein